LLEPIGGHPWAVLRVLRPARNPLDAVESAQHLGLSRRQRGAAGLVRAGEVIGGDASESAGTPPIASVTATVFRRRMVCLIVGSDRRHLSSWNTTGAAID